MCVGLLESDYILPEASDMNIYWFVIFLLAYDLYNLLNK